MNINFQNIAGQKNEQGMSLKAAEISERSFPAYTRTGAVADVSSGLHLDIDATGFSDNAYAGHKRNMDEITNAAQGEDVRNRHNYMALLSNTMSGEDYAKAMEDGFDIKSTDAKETVTIVDKIKSVLLQSGEEIAGFNDDLSLDKLKKITGSEAFANSLEKSFHDNDIPLTTENVKSAKSAYEQIEDIKSLDDSAVKYLVLNDMEPTIENIYFAAHSTNGQNMSGRGFYAQEMGGYYAQKADSFDWEQLSPQIDKVIEEAGLSAVRNKSKENARWMVQQGIPLTAQNLEKLNDIKSIDFPVDESKGAEAIAAAIADGKKATAGNVADPRSNLYKAADLVQQVNSIDDSALKENIIRGKELTIRNLTAAMSGTSSSVQSPASTASVTAGAVPGPASSIPETDERLVSARLQLEEVRLRMTVEANKQLLDSGYSIDTSPMEDLIEHLKATLSRQGAEAAGGAVDEITGVSDMRRGASLHFTMTRIAVIAEGPADVVGELSGEF